MYTVTVYCKKNKSRQELKVFFSSDHGNCLARTRDAAQAWRKTHAPEALTEVCLVPLL